MQDLKDKAAALQDKLSDLHADYMQSSAKQASPQAAAIWQQQWEQQARDVTAAQTILKTEGVGMHTAERLAGAEQAAGRLGEMLADLKSGGGGGP
ncbi:hypothetical protein ABPG75_005469 [Micractinium tetrahymenae]